MTESVLALGLDRDLDVPLPTQLAQRIRGLVADGVLERGRRLPSTRALAADLGVSRVVATQAYEQLVAEGWLEGRHGAGTFVAAAPVRPVPVRPTRPASGAGPARIRLDTGTPWIDPRHRAGWRRAWREVSAAVPPRGYDDPRGIAELRTMLADRLRRQRGVSCSPEDVIVTQGTGDGLRLLLEALPDGPVAVEDPGYRAAVATVRAAGRDVVDLPAGEPIDDLGGLAAVYVTPAHQHPLGRVMPAAERVTLLDAARRAGALVVEDDYDSEFRYDVAPVPALASLDRTRVAYVGTASKAVSPSLRLGWLVAPPEVTERIVRSREVRHEAAPWPVQRAFLALLRDGYVDQVVRSARRVYAERAPRVEAVLAPHARSAGASAGMYSTWLLDHDRAVAVRTALREQGFDVNLLADHARSSGLTGLVVGFGGVSEEELDTALAVIAETLGRTAR